MLPADKRQKRLENEAAANLVRQRNRERYWSTLFAPPEKRAALIALYALDAELAHIVLAAHEPMVAQIRLQWWRDAIDLAAPGNKTGNPVADALSAAILEYDLPKQRLIELADARVPEIFGDAPADIAGLRASLHATYGAVFELSASILGDGGDLTGKAAEHAGLAYGLTQTLRTVALQAARRKLLLPPSYFEGRGVNLTAVYQGKSNAAFGAALADLRGAAARALQQFRALSPQLDPAIWPAFLPLSVVKPYLKAMAVPSFTPLHTMATVNPARRFWKVWRAARRGVL